jgi:hypothetical protein
VLGKERAEIVVHRCTKQKQTEVVDCGRAATPFDPEILAHFRSFECFSSRCLINLFVVCFGCDFRINLIEFYSGLAKMSRPSSRQRSITPSSGKRPNSSSSHVELLPPKLPFEEKLAQILFKFKTSKDPQDDWNRYIHFCKLYCLKFDRTSHAFS